PPRRWVLALGRAGHGVPRQCGRGRLSPRDVPGRTTTSASATRGPCYAASPGGRRVITLPLELEDKGQVRILSLKRPEKKNAFDLALTETLWSALENASEDPSIHVVVVTGFGDYFTAGADVNLFLGGAEGDITKVARLYEPLKACKK